MPENPSPFGGISSASSSAGFGIPRKPRGQRFLGIKLRIYSAIGVISMLLLGLVAVVAVSQTNADLRNFAWGGINFSSEILQQGRTDIGMTQNVQFGSPETARLFQDLTFTYAKTADIANLEVAEFNLRGTAFRAFNPELNQSFIFLRIENLPVIQNSVPTAWLEKKPGEYLKVGVGEFLLENDVIVLYVVTSVEGNTDEYVRLLLSYDSTLTKIQPESVFLSMDFNKEGE